MEGHHTDKRITCLLWLDDDFVDSSSISLNGWPNHEIEKTEHYDTYLSHKTTKTYVRILLSESKTLSPLFAESPTYIFVKA